MDEQQAREFGAYLRNRREELGLSTRQLAAAVGIDMAQIVRWEQGKVAFPRADLIEHVAAALKVPTVDLLTLVGYPITRKLPSLRPYMRATYKDLPPEAVDELEALVAKLQRKHGGTGPADGEDEA